MAIGYLSIQARTAHEAVPLSGVRIQILDDMGNTVYTLTTDESGETEAMPLETVDKSFSLNQYYSGMPYVNYSVLAQSAGFDSLLVSDIPIFDGETASLPISLIPMHETQRRSTQTEISIGQPAVSMQEQRNQEGSTAAPYVLRQVVIPNPITVHLGAPSASAVNVQVSFLDYVKNVASSEIYPTWPEAALTANIYAIITFALNRVYTEWYRSRGYGFDITNSTAYDQYFVYGRPIYESVSRIVDRIFNEYVRRQGQNAPYFTSFCNGTTVSCQGMSQWGTVTLANRGLTPIEILRSYYPDDVEIAETNIITGIISSYPGTPLRVGSTGLDVQTIQTYLNRIRRNYPAIPAITDEAGTFGDSTQNAVTGFQRIFGLSPDGIVGNATWYKISSLYTAVTRLADLDSEGNTLGIGTVPPSSVLRQGSRGPDVITLQYLLNVISEYYPSVPAPTQDGIFGSGTQQSVIAFQRALQLAPDGMVGPLTWRALYEVYQGIEQNVPPIGPETGSFEYTVRAGDSLWLIANKYGTTVDAIKRLNGLTSDLINIGQVLKIPSDQNMPYIEYTVRPGDTLWILARRYETTVDAIKRLNGLTSDLLNIGQVLRIPTN
ncbi:MAG: LysM peptidoglycan-binding domain-containing protein [Lachnospiraceae bacterium]|nr:LysM peptidoglycan-binding domain-containing protein [Lachnospiraceae bacterium]